MEWGLCDICVARVCAHALRINDTRLFAETTWSVKPKSRLIASSVCVLLVTEKSISPTLVPPLTLGCKIITHKKLPCLSQTLPAGNMDFGIHLLGFTRKAVIQLQE